MLDLVNIVFYEILEFSEIMWVFDKRFSKFSY